MVRRLLVAIVALGTSGCIFFGIGDGSMLAGGIIVDPDGTPIQNVTLVAQNGLTITKAVSDESGCFLVRAMTAPGLGRFRILATADGYRGVSRKLWTNRINDVVVTLVPEDAVGESRIERVRDEQLSILAPCTSDGEQSE